MSKPKRRAPASRPKKRGEINNPIELEDEDLESTGPPPSGSMIFDLDDDDDFISALPDQVPVLPLRTDVVFPQTVVPLIVNRPAGIRLIDHALAGDKLIALATQRNPEVDEPVGPDLYKTLTVGTVLKMLKFPDGTTRIVCQGMMRKTGGHRVDRALPDRQAGAHRRSRQTRG